MRRTTLPMEVSHIDMEPLPDEVDKLHDELVQKIDTSKHILKFLEKKLALEEEYATQVRQLCKAQPSLGTSGTAGSFSVLVSMICDQASFTLSNLTSLNVDAVSPLKAALLQVKGDINDTYTEGRKLQHERKRAYDNYKKARYIYESLSRDEQFDKTTVAAESDYRNHMTTLNKIQSTYYRDQLPIVINQFQAAENLRATRTQDGMMKFIDFLSDAQLKTSEALKTSQDKLSTPALLGSSDMDMYRKFCEEFTQPPPDVQFGQEYKEKNQFSSPSLRNILKHGKSTSAKWRNSFTALTSPNRDSKKMKRQSMPSKSGSGLFGSPLHILLEHQKKTFPKLDVPYVAYYLVNHFRKTGGMQTENVFRVPGQTVEVQNIKAALEAGEFTDNLFSSVHTTTSALTMCDHCLGYKTPDELLRVFYGLPNAHCSMLVYLISFIADLARTENQVKTHMDADNLAMVFTPSIVRSQNAADVLMNIEKERQFVLSAIDAADMLLQTFPDNEQFSNFVNTSVFLEELR